MKKIKFYKIINGKIMAGEGLSIPNDSYIEYDPTDPNLPTELIELINHKPTEANKGHSRKILSLLGDIKRLELQQIRPMSNMLDAICKNEQPYTVDVTIFDMIEEQKTEIRLQLQELGYD